MCPYRWRNSNRYLGGHKVEAKEWSEDTPFVACPGTKAALALCAHMLIERGELGLEEKGTKYWPEYGKNGKRKCNY